MAIKMMPMATNNKVSNPAQVLLIRLSVKPECVAKESATGALVAPVKFDGEGDVAGARGQQAQGGDQHAEEEPKHS